MERTLKLVGKTSNEIFMLRYPRSVLNFCDYDLAYFAENAVSVCNQALKDGEFDFDRITDLRNSLKDAHVYIEHHIRTTYEKIVTDCWIDYVCRRDNIGTGALWNRFIGCNTTFEKNVFQRLCDYRYNRAINEWLNLVRIQDYAKSKINFIFSKRLSGAEEAASRRNYFDLMFSVAAKEMGCRLEDLGVTKVFSVGRLPSAPFLLPNVSKDIVKNLLADFDYGEDYSDVEIDDKLSDQIAMDAFSHIKGGLAQEFDSYNITRCSMENVSSDVYMPCSFKAAIDLEIDALIESGGWLARCRRCGRYFLRDSEHTEEYCSLPNPGTKTCLELYEEEHPRSLVTPEMQRQCRAVTDEMYSRVDRSMSLEEYESWKTYLDALVVKVENGEIPPEELVQFIDYSRSMDLSRSKPLSAVPKKEQEAPRERVVKPFVPQRISRSELPPTREEPAEEEEQPRREAFFTSPSVQRQKSERASISHIIRAGEPRGEAPVRQSREFVPFVREFPSASDAAVIPPEREDRPVEKAPSAPVFTPFAAERSISAEMEAAPRETRNYPHEIENSARETRNYSRETENGARETRNYPRETDYTARETKNYNLETLSYARAAEQPAAAPEPHEKALDGNAPSYEKQAAEDASAPQIQPRVIRKNAAAISAYGRMSGTPMSTAPLAMDQISRPKPPTATEEPLPAAPNEAEPVREEPDRDPFKDIGSIFDVLEQSENSMSGGRDTAAENAEQREKPKNRRRHAEKPSEPSEEPARERKLPERVGADNAPSGIWTEERHLFDNEPEEPQSELNMLKEKKHGRSSKTQRLFDVIMREPEDNPNFRRK